MQTQPLVLSRPSAVALTSRKSSRRDVHAVQHALALRLDDVSTSRFTSGGAGIVIKRAKSSVSGCWSASMALPSSIRAPSLAAIQARPQPHTRPP
jgi:hypothetical protein